MPNDADFERLQERDFEEFKESTTAKERLFHATQGGAPNSKSGFTNMQSGEHKVGLGKNKLPPKTRQPTEMS